jgi:hypothetical protein
MSQIWEADLQKLVDRFRVNITTPGAYGEYWIGARVKDGHPMVWLVSDNPESFVNKPRQPMERQK